MTVGTVIEIQKNRSIRKAAFSVQWDTDLANKGI